MHQPLDWYTEADDEGTADATPGNSVHSGKSTQNQNLHFGTLDDRALLQLMRKIGLGSFANPGGASAQAMSSIEKEAILGGDVSISGIAQRIRAGHFKKLLVLAGAGISASAGIPTFRCKDTGIYHNAEQRFNVPTPESIFELDFFRHRPEPLYELLREIFRREHSPTASHYFLKLLARHNALLRLYTQNIDMLERKAGIPSELVVEAHGSLHAFYCLECQQRYSWDDVRTLLLSHHIPRCSNFPCTGLLRPDIVFFGEPLLGAAETRLDADLAECDLFIVMGTSLSVEPFASVPTRIPDHVPRLLINRDVVGKSHNVVRMLGIDRGFLFDEPGNYRDVKLIGHMDECVREFARELGWEQELDALIDEGTAFRRFRRNTHTHVPEDLHVVSGKELHVLDSNPNFLGAMSPASSTSRCSTPDSVEMESITECWAEPVSVGPGAASSLPGWTAAGAGLAESMVLVSPCAPLSSLPVAVAPPAVEDKVRILVG